MTWRVVGRTSVLGVEPGGIIEQDIPRRQAAQLVWGGHIAEVTEQAAPPAAEQEAPAPAADNPQEGD